MRQLKQKRATGGDTHSRCMKQTVGRCLASQLGQILDALQPIQMSADDAPLLFDGTMKAVAVKDGVD